MDNHQAQIIEMYTIQNLSTHVIAEHFGTYHQKITRYLKRWGVVLKSKSTAQKEALSSGRFEHPTKGTIRSDEVKQKISAKMVDSWAELSSVEKKRRVEKARENWDNLPEEQKKSLQEAAHAAIRVSAKDGSKLEIFVKDGLISAGIAVIFHKKELIPNNRLEVDLFIPHNKVAIEIDGPSHFLPIWGEAKLLKTMASDMQKGGLLNANGVHLIRVKQLVKTVSTFRANKILQELIDTINSLNGVQHPQIIELQIGTENE